MLDDKKWHIWFEEYDDAGNSTGGGVYQKEYVHYGNACRVADKLFGNKPNIKYTVANRNPWTSYTCTKRCDICGSEYSAPETNDGYPILNRIYIGSVGKPVFDESFIHYRYPREIDKGYIPCPQCVERVNLFIESLVSVKKEDR